jgi:hypothetical protein
MHPENAHTESSSQDQLKNWTSPNLGDGAAVMTAVAQPDPWDGLSDDERATIRRAEEALVTERLSFERWLEIGHGLHLMQVAVMRLAHANRPYGKRYNEAYKRVEQPVPEIKKVDHGTRSAAIWLYENHERVRSWRQTLSQNQRDSWNNPRTIQRQFEKATRAGPDSEPRARPSKNEIIAEQEQRIDALERQRGRVAGDQFDLETDSPRNIARILVETMTLDRAEALVRAMQAALKAVKRVSVAEQRRRLGESRHRRSSAAR